ncbi:MAG: methyltransferase [Trueperaceae bacterium]
MSVTLTPSCRGHPTPPPGWSLLTNAAAEARGDLLDAAGLLGLPARAAARAERVRVLEPSAAGLAALRHDLRSNPPEGWSEDRATVEAGLPWDAPPASADVVALAPPAERGSARVLAELAAASYALRPDGTAWVLLEKDRGAKRYERSAERWFDEVRVTARSKGWRLARLTGPRPPTAHELDRAVWTGFEGDPGGPAWAVAGCYAAGKLDPGTATLLRTLEARSDDEAAELVAAGRALLDLGCGWGPLTAWATRRGAIVTATDDDLAAVRSCRRTLAELPGGEAATVLHGDLDDALTADARFEAVLLNPPFHLGSGVRVGLGQAFVQVAARRLAPGGEAWIVANEALPYERRHEGPERVCVVHREAGFKIVRLRAPTRR